MGEPVYRGYDQEALDWQYDNRRRARVSADYVAFYQAASIEARNTLPCTLDISFGPSDAEVLDIFGPARPGLGEVEVASARGSQRALSAPLSAPQRARRSAARVPATLGTVADSTTRGSLCHDVSYELVPASRACHAAQACGCGARQPRQGTRWDPRSRTWAAPGGPHPPGRSRTELSRNPTNPAVCSAASFSFSFFKT